MSIHHPKHARLVRSSVEPQNKTTSLSKHRGIPFISQLIPRLQSLVRRRLFLKPKFLRRAFAVIILLVTVSWSFQYWIPSSNAFAAPWSPTHGSYGQRKQLTLVNNSGQTFESGTTYKITIDTASLYNTGSLLSTCDDLRVVYQPSNTTAVELKRAVEYASGSSGVTTCGTSSATKVVFQLQASLANAGTDSNYYIYYDNPQTSAYSSSDALDAYNVGSKEATFVAPFNGTTTALAAGSGIPTTATGAIRYSGGKSALIYSKDFTDINNIASLMTAPNLTVEFWVYVPIATEQSCYAANTPITQHTGNFQFSVCGNGSYVVWGAKSTNKYIINVGNLIGQWHHIALVRNLNANSNYLYIDGVQKDTDTYGVGAGGVHAIMIGRDESYATNQGFTMDELRVSESARYTSNFTPSTTPFVRDEYTKLLLHFDENGDDPRNTGKAIDDSGNGNHGTITGAKYVGGLIGVDSRSGSGMTGAGYQSSQGYAGHEGVFIEEGTTNKITNPSFDHAAYNTNWSSPAVFDYDSSADTFTASMAKRNSAGPFASGVTIQGDAWGDSNGDLITYPLGSQTAGDLYAQLDRRQGTITFWYTPEYNSSTDTSIHGLFAFNTDFNGLELYYDSRVGYKRFNFNGIVYSQNLVAGTTYLITIRWATDYKLDGTNYLSISVDDTHGFGKTSAPSITASTSSIKIGQGNSGGVGGADGIIEGLTIYRRPLFDGTYGIDVGNGDEINQIYNSGTGKDPTLVTGSWDVVFALPTNASTGALATGTGNAWSHPHSSNLLYTSTTNTGGFMMNGTYTSDGWVGKNGDSQTLTLQPDGTSGNDTRIYEADPSSNFGTGTYLHLNGGGTGYGQKSFLKFDLSSLAGNTVTSAILSLYQFATNYGLDNATNTVHRVLSGNSSWTESGATWNTRDGSNGWAGSAGASTTDTDYSSTSMGSFIWDKEGAVGAEYAITLSTSELTTAVSNDYGFLLKSATSADTARICSSDHATSAYRPKLVVNYTSPPTVSALATGEKLFSGGYKFTSTAANQGISRSFTATNGGDYVMRAIGHADASCQPQVKVVRADGTTEVTHLNGASNTSRTTPSVYIFTFESPASETFNLQLLNLNSSGTCYWHQVEVLSNSISNPSVETGSGSPWVPTGWSSGKSQETSDVHSGNSAIKVDALLGDNIEVIYPFTTNIGSYYGMGAWSKRVSGTGTHEIWRYSPSPTTYEILQDGSNAVINVSATSWSHLPFVVYGSAKNRTMLRYAQWSGVSTHLWDDIYTFPLSDVPLTVTPATEANSLETSGLRVDGTDTLTQPIDSLTATSGTIKFKYTPRVSASVATSFGFSTPSIMTATADIDDYIALYYGSGSLIAQGSFNGTLVMASYASPTFNAGTTYDIEMSYTNGGNLVLKIGGVQVASQSGVVSFGTVPTTMYWGSDRNGNQQYGGTISAPDFTGTITPTENTTTPYHKFGSKSLKLVASADGRYVTSINPGNTNTHTFSAYVYDGTMGNVGGTVSATVAKFVFNGNVVTPASYTDMGGGWWRLTYSAVTANAAGDYGIAVLSGKTIYVDGVQLEEKAYTTTYADGTMGGGYAWSGTAHESTSTRTASDLTYSTTSNISTSEGTVSMWFKPNMNYPSGQNFGNKLITLFSLTGGSGSLKLYWTTNGTGTWRYEAVYSNGGNNWVDDAGSDSLTMNEWDHLVIQWSSSGVRMYKDNISGALNSTTLSYTSPTSIVIGYGGSSTFNYLNGVSSDLKIYSSALTSTEVADLYYSGLGSHSSLAPVATERYTDGDPPILAWHTNEGYGTTTYDSTINQNSGTVSGATWSDDSGQAGMTGSKSLKFDGVDDKVSRSYSNDPELAPGTSPFSVSTWFKHPSTVTGTDTLISRYSSTGSGGGYKVYMNSSGFICFGVNDDTTWGPDDSACTTVSYADSTWHHVLAIKGTSTIAVYIDGTQKASTTLSVSSSLSGSSPTFYVGIDSDGASNPWDGFIDEVRVYNSVRSEEQINQEYISKGTNKGVSVILGSGATPESLSNGLVGHWKMDEASWNGTAGEVIDTSGNGNNGVRSGDATTAVGKYGNGGTFDGGLDYVSVTSQASLNPTAQLSVGGWVKYADISDEQYYSLARKGGQYNLYIPGSSNAFAFYVYGVNDCTTTNSYSSMVVGNWYHVMGTYDGSSKKVYVNGALIGNTACVAGALDTSANILQLGYATSDYDVNGSLDDVRIYNRALSPAEVRALYEYAPGPVAHYTFDEGSGQSAYDKSGNSNTGTLGASASQASDDPQWTNGKYGKGLSFDGNNEDYIEVSSLTGSSLGANPWTASFWVNAQDMGTDAPWQRAAITWGVHNGVGNSSRILVTDDTISWESYNINGGGSSFVVPGGLIGKWNFLSYNFDGTNIRAYLNGSHVWSFSAPTLNVTSGPFRIGRPVGSNGTYKGLIDDIKFYNYARTPKQIIQDMNAGHPAVGSPVGSAVAHYKFDEGQGTVARNSGNGGSTLNGTLTNMSSPATSTSGWTNDGKIGKALNFDGSDDIVEIANNTALNPSSLALSAWVKMAGSPPLNGGSILTKQSTGFGGGYSLRIKSDSTGEFIFNGSSGLQRLTTTTILSQNVWYHVIGTYDQTTGVQRIYLNGKLENTQTLAGSPTITHTSTGLGIGRADVTGVTVTATKLNGSIDEAKIYSYALSEDEVKLEYNQGKAIVMGSLGTTTDGKIASNAQSRAYCPPGNVEGNCAAGLNPAPVAEWNFDDPSVSSGQSAVDTSGNNNTGQLGSISGVDASDPTWTNGKTGKGLSFDGSDDYVLVGDPASGNLDFGTGDFSLGAWVRYSGSISPTQGYSIINKGASGSVGYGLTIFGTTVCSSTKPAIGVDIQASGGVNQHVCSSATELEPNIWYRVDAVYDRDVNISVYINGRLAQSSPYSSGNTGSVSNGVNFYIGRYFNPVWNHNGSIDNVHVYNYARTPAQIAWDYNKGAPLVQYKFNECSGTTINNSVPNANAEEAGNNATLTIGASLPQTSAGTCSSGNTAEAWNNGTTGKISSSISFDGADDYARISSRIIPSGDFSISTWFRATNIATSQWLVTQGELSVGTWLGFIINSSKLKNESLGITGSTTLLSNTWYHAVLVYSSVDGKEYIYLNGNLDGSGSVTPTYTGDNVTIGGNPATTPGGLFAGQMDDVRIYNHALSPVQVRDVYNNGAVSFK